MITTSVETNREAKLARNWLVVAYIVVISIAADAALLLTAADHWSWLASTVTSLAAGLITAGILFTVLEMLRIGRSRID